MVQQISVPLIPVWRMNEEDIPTLNESLPSVVGREGEGVLWCFRLGFNIKGH